jgi:ADP-ribosylglycohydrolase
MSITKRIIFSQALSDAIGLTTEFMSKEEVYNTYGDISKKKFSFDMIINDYHRGNWKKGDWTDDTDIMLIRYLLMKDNELTAKKYTKKLINWIDNGFKECGDDKSYGLGNSFAIWQGDKYVFDDPIYSGFRTWVLNPFRPFSNSSNGSLMASGILAIIDDDKKRHNLVIEINRITHTDPKTILACLFQTELMSFIIKNKNYLDFDSVIESITPKFKDYCDEINKMLNDYITKSYSDEIDILIKEKIVDYLNTGNEINYLNIIKEMKEYLTFDNIEDLKLDKNIGYCFKPIGCIAVTINNLKKTFVDNIINIIKEGGDADTNASIVGAVLGCIYTFDDLPSELINSLPYKDFLFKIIS